MLLIVDEVTNDLVCQVCIYVHVHLHILTYIVHTSQSIHKEMPQIAYWYREKAVYMYMYLYVALYTL